MENRFVPMVTTRRAALAAGLSLAIARRPSTHAHELGRLDSYDPLAWLPALPDDPVLYPISILTHADMAAYWETRGIDPAEGLDEETAEHWIEIGQYLPVNDGITLQQLAQDWDSMVGFSLLDV